MIKETLESFFPTFGLILTGFLAGKIFRNVFAQYQKKIVSVILNFLVPVFIVTSLGSNKFANSYLVVSLAALLVLVGGTILAVVYSRIFQKSFGEVCLPIVFMNSAYLAIPINTVLFGETGTTLAIMYSAMVTIIHFTFGIRWVNKEKRIRAFLELPPVYAVGVGILLSVLGQFPVGLKSVVAGINRFILVLMLMFVGYKVSDFSFRHNFLAVLGGLTFRLAGGFFLALGVIKLLNLRGVAAGVVLITSAMPSAINTYLLTEHFEQGADFAAAMIISGLLLSFIFWLELFPLATKIAGY